MRYFALLNLQHFFLYLLPALASIIIFAVGLGFYHITRPDSAERVNRIIEEFPGGIKGRNAPFPFILIMIIGGTVIWSVAYILWIGLGGVRI